MSGRKILYFIGLIMLLALAACGNTVAEPGAAEEATATPAPTATPRPAATPTTIPDEVGETFPPAVAAAREELAAAHNLDPQEIEVVSFERQEWPDACLGLAAADEMCAQVITPGWLVMLQVEGQTYEIHTDQNGNAVRIAGSTSAGAAEPVIIFRRSGGVAGKEVEYRILARGMLEKRSGDQPAGVEMLQVAPEEVAQLLEFLKASGFFELEGDYFPEDPCCDRFHYTITVNDHGRTHTIETVEATPGVPDAVWDSIELIQQFIENVESGSSQ